MEILDREEAVALLKPERRQELRERAHEVAELHRVSVPGELPECPVLSEDAARWC